MHVKAAAAQVRNPRSVFQRNPRKLGVGRRALGQAGHDGGVLAGQVGNVGAGDVRVARGGAKKSSCSAAFVAHGAGSPGGAGGLNGASRRRQNRFHRRRRLGSSAGSVAAGVVDRLLIIAAGGVVVLVADQVPALFFQAIGQVGAGVASLDGAGAGQGAKADPVVFTRGNPAAGDSQVEELQNGRTFLREICGASNGVPDPPPCFLASSSPMSFSEWALLCTLRVGVTI